MTTFTIILFVHILATLALSTALGLEAFALHRLVVAADLATVRLWTNPMRRLRIAEGSSLAALMLSGVYLTAQMSAWPLAWAQAAILSLLLFGALAGLGFRRMSAIRAIGEREGATLAELAGRLRDPVITGSLNIRLVLMVGTVLLMTTRPSAVVSLAILVVSFILGLLIAFVIRRSLPDSGLVRDRNASAHMGYGS